MEQIILDASFKVAALLLCGTAAIIGLGVIGAVELLVAFGKASKNE